MNNELEIYYKILLTNYIFNKLNIKDYEKKLEENNKDILILNNKESKYFELANYIYLDKLSDNELKYLKESYINKISYNKDLEYFIENTYKKVIRYDLEEKNMIYYETDNVDTDSFILDGTIVLKIYYKENIFDDLKMQLDKIAKLVKDTEIYDDEMSKILNNSVKTICISKLV